MAWWSFLLGGTGKSTVEKLVETATDYMPSKVKQHEMALEDVKAGDDSQRNAQQLQLVSHTTWLDVVIDGANRCIRPLFSIWAFCVLAGWIKVDHLAVIPPMAWNVIWTIIGFWFGTRMVFKDIPMLIKALKN